MPQSKFFLASSTARTVITLVILVLLQRFTGMGEEELRLVAGDMAQNIIDVLTAIWAVYLLVKGLKGRARADTAIHFVPRGKNGLYALLILASLPLAACSTLFGAVQDRPMTAGQRYFAAKQDYNSALRTFNTYWLLCKSRVDAAPDTQHDCESKVEAGQHVIRIADDLIDSADPIYESGAWLQLEYYVPLVQTAVTKLTEIAGQ